MAWSGQIYPERYMQTVAEDTPAEKRKESYKLVEEFLLYLAKNLIFGAQTNYETAKSCKDRKI
ncbi:hypothetical protein MASR2M69_18480 [Bacteroidota bacterium]